MKTHQRPQIFMHPFPDVYQAFGTSNDHQKPIYVSPGGRKKGHQQSLSQARKKCTHKSSYFSPNCKFEVFLINSRTITFARTNHFLKIRRKNSLSWKPDHSKVRKKKSFLVNFHIWHKFSSFKTTNCLLMGSNRSHYVY